MVWLRRHDSLLAAGCGPMPFAHTPRLKSISWRLGFVGSLLLHQDGLWTLDVNYSWQVTAASGINMSVRNLFAEDPPITRGGNQAFFNRNRRTFSLQYTHSFAN